MRNIIVDAGPLIALFRARDHKHKNALAALESNPARLLTTWPVLTAACHFLRQDAKRAMLAFVRRGAMRVEPLSVEDLPRIDELLARYERMDFADASVVVLAEKTGTLEIMTFDRRDFETYRTRPGGRFKLLLA